MNGRKRRRLGWEIEKIRKRPGSREIDKKIGVGERERTTERKRETRVGEKGREKR